jgi:hypothetical protein
MTEGVGVKYGDISPQVAAYSTRKMLEHVAPALTVDLFSKSGELKPTHTYLDVSCSVCEAPPGSPCRAVRRHFNWINDKHAERVEDARLVAEAVKALMPPPDTVTFRWPKLTIK